MAGPVEMPQGPCPAAIHSPSTPSASPTSGRPSSDCGRAQARTPRGRARDSAGRKAAARARTVSTHAFGSGSSPRKVEPTEVIPRRRDGAEDRAGPAARVGHRLDADLLDHVARRRAELELDDDAPHRRDRSPGACRVDHLGGPRAGRDEHGARGAADAAGDHAVHVTGTGPRPGHLVAVERDALLVRPQREGARRLGGLDRVAGVEPARRQTLGQRRLEHLQLAAMQHRRPQLGDVAADLGCGLRELGRVERQQQDAGRVGGHLEALEPAVQLERLVVELGHDRVERMLQHSGVAPARGSRDAVALEDLDLRARLGQQRRGGATDYPSADDRDVGVRASAQSSPPLA